MVIVTRSTASWCIQYKCDRHNFKWATVLKSVSFQQWFWKAVQRLNGGKLKDGNSSNICFKQKKVSPAIHSLTNHEIIEKNSECNNFHASFNVHNRPNSLRPFFDCSHTVICQFSGEIKEQSFLFRQHNSIPSSSSLPLPLNFISTVKILLSPICTFPPNRHASLRFPIQDSSWH